MRKGLIGASAVFLLAVAVGAAMYLRGRETRTVGTFDFSEYRQIAEQFPADAELGAVSSAEAARESAEKIWADVYGEMARKSGAYRVSFDKQNRVWLIEGGGALGDLCLLVRSNGRALAVWHGK